MTDDEINALIERLGREGESAMRRHLSMGMWKLCADAASALSQLLAERAALREAIKPLVYKPVEDIFKGLSDEQANYHHIELDVHLGDMRRARAALEGAPIAQVVHPPHNT